MPSRISGLLVGTADGYNLGPAGITKEVIGIGVGHPRVFKVVADACVLVRDKCPKCLLQDELNLSVGFLDCSRSLYGFIWFRCLELNPTFNVFFLFFFK